MESGRERAGFTRRRAHDDAVCNGVASAVDGRSTLLTDVSAKQEEEPLTVAARAGLCASCSHVQVVQTSKRSTFFLCRLSDTDPRFPKYPVVPVLDCAGYRPGAGGCR
jgi:hypothetical protein